MVMLKLLVSRLMEHVAMSRENFYRLKWDKAYFLTPEEYFSSVVYGGGSCRQQGHNRTTCLDHGDVPKQPRIPARCKNCSVMGH
uniref:Uncharacterized protein n=1 Tax=Aegilops tauschii subsp. strangulata TaxID=200361 RepID=A0A453I363_AEGTS